MLRLGMLVFFIFASAASLSAADLKVHFINVGQGDCTLLQCPDGVNVLVDCGSTSGGDADVVRAYVHGQLDPMEPKIDVLVITHPDKDHYSFLPRVLEGVDIGKILLTDEDDAYKTARVNEWLEAFTGPKIILDEDHFDLPDMPSELFDSAEVQFFVLAANIKGHPSPTNTPSIVLMVTFDSFDLLLTGDATLKTEKAILARYDAEWLDVEVLKIGHHGSDATSTGQQWALATKPDVATVSCAFQNGYGHPRREVIKRLEPFTAELATSHAFRWGFNPPGPDKVAFEDFDSYEEAIYTTARNGNILITSDGSGFNVAFDGQIDPFPRDSLLAHADDIADETAALEMAAGPSLAPMPGATEFTLARETSLGGVPVAVLPNAQVVSELEIVARSTETLREEIEDLSGRVDELARRTETAPAQKAPEKTVWITCECYTGILWPLVTLIIAFVFREAIVDALSRTKRLQWGGLEVEFDKQVAQLLRLTPVAFPLARDLGDRMSDLLSKSPRQAIISAISEVQEAFASSRKPEYEEKYVLSQLFELRGLLMAYPDLPVRQDQAEIVVQAAMGLKQLWRSKE